MAGFETVDHARCVASGYHAELRPMTLGSYNLSGFNTPITDLRVAKLLDGLDPQSIAISRNSAAVAQLNTFYDRFVTPSQLERTTSEGTRAYDQTFFSSIGHLGSLLHMRLCAASDGSVVPGSRNVAVIGHLDDPSLAAVESATHQVERGFDGTIEHTFTIGQPAEVSLQVVNRPMNETEWEVEKTLLREQAIDSVPIVQITANARRYRRSDGHWETLRDMATIRERVAVSLSRGLGYYALSVVQEEPRQYTENVLGLQHATK